METKRFLIGISCVAVALTAVSVHYGWGPLLAQTSPKAHWEPYKARKPKPSVDQKLTDPVLTGSIDLHAHFGPDSYDRQWDAFEIAKLAKERACAASSSRTTGRSPLAWPGWFASTAHKGSRS